MGKTIIVTGGAGFIGANYILRALGHYSSSRIVNLDALTYAGNLDTLSSLQETPQHIFEHGSINDAVLVGPLLEKYQPSAIINFAAESHVDRSIDSPEAFIQTNILGTFQLLESARKYWRSLTEAEQRDFRFLHVSTDEVYGSLGPTGKFTETTPYQPNSPYSASKASSDHLVRAYFHTYGMPVLTTNCSNNYGPYHFPEKLIPLTIIRALRGERLPVYGKGENVRDWLHVEDHAEALTLVLRQGKPGETYNVGGDSERKNIDVVRTICRLLDEMQPQGTGRPHETLIEFVTDRPGHDARYAIDSAKIQRELGWRPRHDFEDGLRQTVRWYLDNRSWWERVMSGAYRGERLGLS